MAKKKGEEKVHPADELAPREGWLAIDTAGRRVHVDRDPEAQVTPLGQLVLFTQFKAASGGFPKRVLVRHSR